jgi:mRNA interferase RelE/StbE
MRYAIQYKPAALRQLHALPHDIQARVQAAIEGLGDNPFPPKVKKMAGSPDRWRIRVGDYRVVYEVHSHRLMILVIAVGHRREIYR